MKITSSYAVEFKCDNMSALKETLDVFHNAVSYVMNVANTEWDSVFKEEKAFKKQQFVERLIHSVKGRKAKYDFDASFYKMPSYLRRNVIQKAIGNVSGYRSNYANWKDNPVGKAPSFQTSHYDMPTYYYDNMYVEKDGAVKIKVFFGGDWKFIPIRMKKTDISYIRKHFHGSLSAPTLEKNHGKWFLRFAVTEDKKLSEIEVSDQTVCAVDLGINNDAVCSIMKSNGTILARKFINFPSDKDRMIHSVNRIKAIQQHYCPKQVRGLWNYVQRCNDEHAKKISRAIVDFAILNSCDCIVFEHLSFKGKKRGSRKQRLTMWRKNGVIKYAEHDAHRHGIHISRVCAWGTSKLAYDGSGDVVRDEDNHSLCTFANGKRYHSDLSASYNIGARYFVRDLFNNKSFPEKGKSDMMAKVPSSQRRTETTLSTLLECNAFLGA